MYWWRFEFQRQSSHLCNYWFNGQRSRSTPTGRFASIPLSAMTADEVLLLAGLDDSDLSQHLAFGRNPDNAMLAALASARWSIGGT
jgi:hypothetical protein